MPFPTRHLMLFLLLLSGTLIAGGQPAWQALADPAFAQARSENKLVLLDLSAEWCAFCEKMDRTTWRDASVVAEIERHYVPVRVVDEQHPVLAERYRAHGRPAVVILDADGNELLRKRGYLKPLWMQWLLQAVTQEQLEP